MTERKLGSYEVSKSQEAQLHRAFACGVLPTAQLLLVVWYEQQVYDSAQRGTSGALTSGTSTSTTIRRPPAGHHHGKGPGQGSLDHLQDPGERKHNLGCQVWCLVFADGRKRGVELR